MSTKGILKILCIGFVAAALWVALLAVMGTVSERSHRREEVYSEMAQTTAGAQIVAGPFLVLPYDVQTTVSEKDQDGEKTLRTETVRQQKYILPRELNIQGRLNTEKRNRSLYEILLYDSQLKMEGEFDFPEPKDFILQPGSTIRRGQPYLVILVQDSRGLTTVPVLNWGAKTFAFKPGNGGAEVGIEGGIHSEMPMELYSGGSFRFSVDLNLRGMQSLSWVPVGEATKVKLTADWPHPSFQGRALPKLHHITAAGFEAEWESTHFGQAFLQHLNDPQPQVDLKSQSIGFKLIDPVDVYVQTERSVKYGFLIIVLTFAAFLAFETLKNLSIHPIQYGFVGLALVIFYVLLLALSEHIAFIWAYLVAAVASISLLTYYVRYVVHSWKRALSFAFSLALLDGLIYVILISEDYALLYGACLLFALLTAAMVFTRRVDWNEVRLKS